MYRQERMMDMSLEGRLKNTQLPVGHGLLTLYESVFNSFHAIEDAEDPDGQIKITIDRDNDQARLHTQNDGTEITEAPVSSVHITDTGIGFNDANLMSFRTGDSLYKAARGGKGVGRFMWLKAFDRVAIDSIFDGPRGRVRRRFGFTAAGGIGKLKDELAPTESRQTTVHLLGLRPEYQRLWPKRLEVMARRLVEHVLIYLMRGGAPHIEMRDSRDSIDVSEFFKAIANHADARTFSIKGASLTVRTIRLYGAAESTHRLHLCAEEREVTSEPLGSMIPDLTRKLIDEQNRRFVVSSFVTGAVLDESLTPDRLNFSLPDASDTDTFADVVTKDDVRRSAAEQIRSYLAPELAKVGQEKRERVRHFVAEERPEYRPLVEHKPELIDQIPPGLTDEKLDAELHRLTHKVEADLLEQARTLLRQEPSDLTTAEAKLRQFIELENAFGKSRLASYVVHRKIVLEFLERRLGVDESGKRAPEAAVHELIFPLRKTSADVPIEQQNLWLIDERLSYHRYLASDVPLNELRELDVEGKQRPDVMIFNAPFAFVETEAPFSSVVIIEFKRPMRDDYDDADNPIAQVYEYVDRIKTGKATDKNGMQFKVPPTTPFYCYIVADDTPKLQKWARFYELTVTPDAGGYFGYNKNVGSYIEVITFQKLLTDAKKRNRILFEKLQLPDKLLPLQQTGEGSNESASDPDP